MSKKSNNNLLLILGVAGVGYYLWSKNQATAPPSQTAVTSTSAPNYGTGSAQTPTPSVVNDPRLTEINQWINTISVANANQARLALTQMSQDEVAGLYDIVHNDFYGNGITTPAQRTFWDTWRVKYHVLDGTYP
jgi:hypothetical protein